MQATQALQRRRLQRRQMQQQDPPEHEGKGFKPCRIHGKHPNHSYEECIANPHNQACYKL